MAVTTGLTGLVGSWSGSFNAAMLALLKPAAFTLDPVAAELDTTPYTSGGAIVKSKIKGLLSWSGSFEGYLTAPANGIAGSVSGSAYATSVRAWDMQIRCEPLDTTNWPISSSWRTFTPGLIEWGGSFEALVDDTTAVKFAGDSTEPLTATFTLASGNTLAGTIFTSGSPITSRVGQLQVVRYNYIGSGHITSVGSANIITAAATLATPVAGSLVLNATSSRTYTGSAFWTEIGVAVNPNAVVASTVRFQGSGSLTAA